MVAATTGTEERPYSMEKKLSPEYDSNRPVWDHGPFTLLLQYGIKEWIVSEHNACLIKRTNHSVQCCSFKHQWI